MSMIAASVQPNPTLAPSAARKRREKRKSRQRGTVVKNVACPACRSKGKDSTGNHLMVFDDGAAHCPKCPKTYKAGEWETANATKNAPKQRATYNGSGYNRPQPLVVADIEQLSSIAFPKRHISLAAMTHFGIKVKVDQSTGQQTKHFYPYQDEDGDTTGYKTRVLPKDFSEGAVGTIKDSCLFGWDKLSTSRRVLIIVEGELDAAMGFDLYKAMNQRSDSRRIKKAVPNVVSLSNGAKGLVKELIKHHKELCKFDKIIWMGDNHLIDVEGAEAMKVAVRALGDRLKIAKYPEGVKDLCDLRKSADIMEEAIDLFADMFFNAEPFVPLNVIKGSDLTLEQLEADPIIGYDCGLESLNEKINGLRLYEHTVIDSASGSGKTSYVKNIALHMNKVHGWKVGNIYLEEKFIKTAQSYVALDNNVSPTKYRENFSCISKEDKKRTMETVMESMTFINHSGSIPVDDLMDNIRYQHLQGVKLITLDHLSMATSGSDDANAALIDLMTQIYLYVEHNDLHVISVIHINKGNSGLCPKKGGEITSAMLLGSSGVEQMSYNLVTIEGNNSHTDDTMANTRFFRVLKTREGGSVGLCRGGYHYNGDTGQIKFNPSVEKKECLENDKTGAGIGGNDESDNKPSMGGYNNKAA